MVSTKIYGTLGPKCNDSNTLTNMYEQGMSGVRLNLSHVSLLQSMDWVNAWHEACKNKGDLLIDMQGPEMRIGKLKSTLKFQKGETVRIPITNRVMHLLKKNQRVHIDDGKVSGAVSYIDRDKNEIKLITDNKGELTSSKSIKIEGVENTLPAITEHDIMNIKAAKDAKVTGVMQPFVRGGEDIRVLKEELRSQGASGIEVFAKIENKRGIERLEEILVETDWVVIARGDLGNDIGLCALPSAQRMIAAACRHYHVPFIVVTQMLSSMEHSPVPTRAEISDIDHAILDGASGVMVTGETAVGDYPIEVIKYLRQTIEYSEKDFRQMN